MKLWKKDNGNTYKSYLDYRFRVITKTYLSGVKMCKEYSSKLKDNKLEKEENDVIKYFEKAQKSKILYLPIHKYFRYLSFKGIGTRVLKEIIILHFPILGFMIFKCI